MKKKIGRLLDWRSQQFRCAFLPQIIILVAFGWGICQVGIIPTKASINCQKSINITSTAASKQSLPMNDNALDQGNVKSLWSEGFRGQGMVVADIDTGIQKHSDFCLSDNQEAKISQKSANRFIAKKGYGTYVSPKIPFAYDYVDNDNDTYEPTPQTSFHGQHTAGIVAANGQIRKGQGQYVMGVAPEAQILALKVYGGFQDESSNNVSRAVHDAVDLGADVINMSFGIGVSRQSLTDEEQSSVKYATDHGVLVSISAGNNGASGSILASSNDNDPGTNYVTYQASNQGTVSNPGASFDAITVGAANTLSSSEDKMASFSSWGPTPDYMLKPDISAPGVQIVSTWEDSGYKTEDGTSMAAPFVSGAALLIMQKIKQQNSHLSGKDLVNMVKLMIMNSGNFMKDLNYHDVSISPRRQGTGEINVTNAANLKVTVADDVTGIGSVSLKQIGKNTKFTLRFTNHGNTSQTYLVDDNGGPLTEKIDASSQGRLYDSKISDSTIRPTQNMITVEPKQTKKVDFILSISDKTPLNEVVEGFLTFKNTNVNQNLTIPYLGYYGDLTTETVIDNPATLNNSLFKGGYLYDEHDNPLGIADADSLSDYMNNHPDTTWQNIGKQIFSNKVAFSPNDDGVQDSVRPYIFAKRNLANVMVEILDAEKKVIRVVDQENNTNKSYYQNGNNYNNDLSMSPSMRINPDRFKWDGMFYDQSTGTNKVAPDGQYTYRIVTTDYNNGSRTQQNFDLPIKVDTSSPKLGHITYQNGTVRGSYCDSGVGFSPESSLVLKIDDRDFGFSLENTGTTNYGEFTCRLNKQQQLLIDKNKQLEITIRDLAGNKTTRLIKTSEGDSKGIKIPMPIAPQFKWNRIGQSGSQDNGVVRKNVISGMDFWQLMTSSKMCILKARVPKDVYGLKAYAKDLETGKVYSGKVNTKTGMVKLIVSFSPNENTLALAGFASVPTSNFGVSMFSNADGLIILRGKNYPKMSELVPRQCNELIDNGVAFKQSKLIGKKLVLPGHKRRNFTSYFAPTEGIKFDGLNDNNVTIIGANSHLYDVSSGEITISGQVNDSNDKLQFLKLPNERDPRNRVNIESNGKFVIRLPFKPTEQRDIGYILTKTDNSGKQTVSHGVLEIITDTEFPTLKMAQANSLIVNPKTGEYNIATTNRTFTVSGIADDNVSGYRVYANSDNVFHEQSDAGFNNHTNLNERVNPYPAYRFKHTYKLLLGDNYFKISAIDQAGNTTTKVFHVFRIK